MLKAVAKRVIVKKLEEEKDEKKIIIQVNENKHIKAVVIHAGELVDKWIAEDEIVILPAHTGTPVEDNGEMYLVVYEDQVLAVVR